jgi:hypothetical protein
MRAPLTLLSRGLAASAAAVLLTACGGDEAPEDSDASPSESSAPATSPESEPEGEAPAADSEFCTESQELLNGLGAAFTEQTDPASVEGAFQEAADGFRSVEPPAEIEDDWATLADGLEEYAAAFADLDESDPESVTEFQQRTTALQGDLTAAATGVESYLNEQCGIDTDQEPTESAPTS